MQPFLRAILILPAIALSGCAVMDQSATYATAPTVLAPTATVALAAPAQTTANAAAMTDITAYVDPAALKQMSSKSKAEAAGAQFGALQFGRVGAPRNWVGDNGAAGQVTVGPYVRVNLIDCRDFTHTITVAGQSFAKKGTACREADGSWTVNPSAG